MLLSPKRKVQNPMTDQTAACPTCAEDATEFREGHCIECWNERQGALLLHYDTFDRWERMKWQQRDNEIRMACR